MRYWQNGQLKNIKFETVNWLPLVKNILENSPTKFYAPLTFDDQKNLNLFQANKYLANAELEQKN